MIDVAVVGAGPVGSRTAGLLAKAGFSVEILEENREVGRPVQCAGLVSPRTRELLGRPRALNLLKGVRVHSALGTVLEVRASEPRAVVIDRSEADKLVAAEAVKADASLRLGWQLSGLETVPSGARLSSMDGRDVEARLVIGADGASSAVRRLSGIEPPGELLTAFECELACGSDEAASDTVDIWLGREVAPGFFGWTIPTGTTLRVGLAMCPGEATAKERLDALVSRAGLDGSRVLGTYAGLLPIGIVERPYSERLMLVGDSAGHVKPLSGGGLFPGLVAAEACAKIAGSCLAAGTLDTASLSRYSAELKGALGTEVMRAASLRAVFKGMDDKTLDSTLRTLSKPSAVALVAREGDIDFPSRLSKGLLAKCPSLLGLAPRALKSLL
ncbi:MAG: NAD(P)/FAD-dependent oxidoreductase [Methanobacteriota archaeon]